MSLSIQHLSKQYGEQKAVNNISFEAKKGEILGFLGPNGAGKSTTMKIATCYVTPSQGTVKVCGYDVLQSPIEVRKNIGYLPEHNPLYLDMYVHEYLLFIGSLHKIKRNILQNRVKEMVALCGLTREQNKKIGALSKGYRQRVGLAQALIHDPQVLILDEPTTGLDPNQIIEIRHVIKSISAEKTVIFSTHIMQEVKALCDRVVIINLGEIVADNPVSALYADKSETIIFVEFTSPIDLSILSTINGVQKIENLSGNKYKITNQGDIDNREEIFRAAVANNLVLLEMRKEEHSLENIFYELTKSNA